jgi:hypothetical protein
MMFTIFGIGVLTAATPTLLQAQNAGELAGAAPGATMPGSPETGATTLAFKDLPWPAQKTMLDRSGYASISNVREAKTAKGRIVYIGSYQKDNQHHRITVARDGTFISDQVIRGGGKAGAATMDFKDLPWPAQKAMLDRSGYASIGRVRETTLPDGRTAYVGSYQKDSQQHRITVAADGTVIGDTALGGTQ